MLRSLTIVSIALAAPAAMVPSAAVAQAHAHSHAGAPVDCTTLASPPWTGLPESDRRQIAAVNQALAHLDTPEAATAAGFRPVLGNIPGMGVHYVHPARSRNGIDIDEPDHLLFAPIDGEERLVGAAYAFQDVVDTSEPLPYQSELARWHDHPEFAGNGQTLHMLHVWFVPSSHGPFAGLNFWLPFHGAGIAAPSACWMADEADAERIQQVAFALVATERGGSVLGRLAAARRGRTDDRAGAPRAPALSEERQAARAELLAEMDMAAGAGDRAAWAVAADGYLADLTTVERAIVDRLLRNLTMAQMSTPEREATGDSGDHQH